jgi:hypothetical protein
MRSTCHLFPNLSVACFNRGPGTSASLYDSRLQLGGGCKMLTVLTVLAGPILGATILMITVFEIKGAWDRNRLR